VTAVADICCQGRASLKLDAFRYLVARVAALLLAAGTVSRDVTRLAAVVAAAVATAAASTAALGPGLRAITRDVAFATAVVAGSASTATGVAASSGLRAVSAQVAGFATVVASSRRATSVAAAATAVRVTAVATGLGGAVSAHVTSLAARIACSVARGEAATATAAGGAGRAVSGHVTLLAAVVACPGLSWLVTVGRSVALLAAIEAASGPCATRLEATAAALEYAREVRQGDVMLCKPTEVSPHSHHPS
jgi:hypothetical protein